MKTSIIIPFKNEIAYAAKTIETTSAFLTENGVDFELIAVDDSEDGTWQILSVLAKSAPCIIAVKGEDPPGYGKALRKGFDIATGDIIIPFNGDFSDSLDDVLAYIRLIEEGYDMVFGSRFVAGAKVNGAEVIKSLISRWGNRALQWLYRAECNDITNSFKAYRSTALKEIGPTAGGYDIVLEMPLRGILRGFKYTTIPVTWTSREYGQSKMSITKTSYKYLMTAIRIRFGTP